MLTKILLITITCAYAGFNFLTSKMMDVKEMRSSFIDGQCVVGVIFTNLFYLPAWVLKGLRFVVVFLVK